MIQFTLNGAPQTLSVDPDMPLLWALRDSIGLTGTKFGCGMGLCGACTVLLNGASTRSCLLRMADVAGASITTIEGAQDRLTAAVQDSWTQLDVPQCGYCQSGQVLAAAALLTGNPRPTDEDIDNAMSGNLCRCGTYHRIRAAVHRVVEKLGT